MSFGGGSYGSPTTTYGGTGLVGEPPEEPPVDPTQPVNVAAAFTDADTFSASVAFLRSLIEVTFTETDTFSAEASERWEGERLPIPAFSLTDTDDVVYDGTLDVFDGGIRAVTSLGDLLVRASIELSLPQPMTPPARVTPLVIPRVSEVMPTPDVVDGIPYEP